MPGEPQPEPESAAGVGSSPPSLHDLVVLLRAPTQAWSGTDGQIRPAGAQGIYHGDVRVLAAAVLTVDGHEPDGVAVAPDGAADAVFVGVARHLGDRQPDPTVLVERRRTVRDGEVDETIDVISAAREPVRASVRLRVVADGTPMAAIKDGRGPVPPATDGRSWSSDGVLVTVHSDGAEHDPAASTLCWPIELATGQRVRLRWRVTATDERAVVGAPRSPLAAPAPWREVTVRADDRRLGALVRQSMRDLDALRMVTAAAPDEPFIAAGAPWFLTLFGRDALWTARLLLPLGTELAGSTLRVLAGLQGRAHDADRAEQPGKIMHELRRGRYELDGRSRLSLPPLYYGTVDATPLWVTLLHDAWRWGMPDEQVRPLLGHVEAALDWLAEHGDADDDGLIEYVDHTGTGLTNQGWKDSADGVRWRDGTPARPPITLCEVQGYAFEAAMAGAALLDSFGRPGADRWRRWAATLAERFRASFWIDDGHGGYPAVALDAAKRPVDALTSNAGHLLGTGLLDDTESARVVRRLAGPLMRSGFGLRTMAADAASYGPLSYHGGAVWPHDTAIVLAGMARAGHPTEAAAMATDLLAAAEAFDYRLPELYSGHGSDQVSRPVPYPAACRPQAWSAAAGVGVLTALLGLVADAPNGTLVARPVAPSPVGAITAIGLRFAGRPVTVTVDLDGTATTRTTPQT